MTTGQMTFDKIEKKALIVRVQSEVKAKTDSLISQQMLSTIFDAVFDTISEVLAEGNEVTTKLGVFKLKTVKDANRRDIGNNTTLPVKGYYRPKLALNNRIRKEFMSRGYSFLPNQETKQVEQA